MFESTALSVALTIVFVVTTVYSLRRLSRMLAGDDEPVARLVELFHLVMGLAMIGMTWGWTGGLGSASGVLQLVVFGAFTLWFGYRSVAGATAHGRLAGAYHLVAAAAMTWMVVAMPLLMGMSGAGGAAGGEGADHHGGGASSAMAGMDGMAAGQSLGWAVAVSVAFVVLLGIAAGAWAHRAFGEPEPATTDSAGYGVVATLTRADVTRSPATPTARVDAGCHLLMSLGMAVMLLAML